MIEWINEWVSEWLIDWLILNCCFCRAEASASRLAELNPYVNIQTSTSSISKDDFDFLKHYQVITAMSDHDNINFVFLCIVHTTKYSILISWEQYSWTQIEEASGKVS